MGYRHPSRNKDIFPSCGIGIWCYVFEFVSCYRLNLVLSPPWVACFLYCSFLAFDYECLLVYLESWFFHLGVALDVQHICSIFPMMVLGWGSGVRLFRSLRWLRLKFLFFELVSMVPWWCLCIFRWYRFRGWHMCCLLGGFHHVLSYFCLIPGVPYWCCCIFCQLVVVLCGFPVAKVGVSS